MGKRQKILSVFVTVILVISLFVFYGFDKRPAEAKDNGKQKNNAVINDVNQKPANSSGQGTIVSLAATVKDQKSLFKNIKLTQPYKQIGYHNPLMTQRFSADPFAMVYNGRVYVYTTNDILEKDVSGKITENKYGKINTLNVISSEDMVNWTDHGTIAAAGYSGAAKWAHNSWAPTATHKTINGKEKFFLYFADSANGIAVLESDSPVGPFVDPIGKPLINRQTPNCSTITWLFDPAVLVDDDGRAYLYFGGGVPTGKDDMPSTSRVVELGADMTSIVGQPKTIDAPFLFEDSGINKIGKTYYYSYCSNWADSSKFPNAAIKPPAAEIIYMTSSNPMGPWTYQGSILLNPGRFFGQYGNNHHSLIQFNDKWYMFYHSQVLQAAMGITGGYRSVHVDEATVTAEGKIQPIRGTRVGVTQIKNLDPYKVTEAETIAWMGGITTVPIGKSSKDFGSVNMTVTDLSKGDWIGVSQVDFGSRSAKYFTAKVASKYAGSVIKITLDSTDGKCIGYLEVPNTKSEDKYTDAKVKLSGSVTGVHDIYFTFAGKNFCFDAWSFQH